MSETGPHAGTAESWSHSPAAVVNVVSTNEVFRSGAGGDPGGGGHGDRPLGTNPDGTAVGDSDGDQRLTAKDAEAALQMSVGLRPLDTNLDLGQDGRVQSGDARQILQEASRTVGVR